MSFYLKVGEVLGIWKPRQKDQDNLVRSLIDSLETNQQDDDCSLLIATLKEEGGPLLKEQHFTNNAASGLG